VAFGITLAVFVGSRLSNEAMAVLTGAVCGVGAVLPATILGALALWRRREHFPAPYSPSSGYGQSYPPVVVVAPSALPGGSSINGWPGHYAPATGAPNGGWAPAVGRQFSVLGEEGVDQ
jgi:hypothetical protein